MRMVIKNDKKHECFARVRLQNLDSNRRYVDLFLMKGSGARKIRELETFVVLEIEVYDEKLNIHAQLEPHYKWWRDTECKLIEANTNEEALSLLKDEL